jgi:hypothetical protein
MKSGVEMPTLFWLENAWANGEISMKHCQHRNRPPASPHRPDVVVNKVVGPQAAPFSRPKTRSVKLMQQIKDHHPTLTDESLDKHLREWGSKIFGRPPGTLLICQLGVTPIARRQVD